VSASAKYPFCKTFFQRLNRFNSYSERGIRELEEERNSNNSKTKQKQKKQRRAEQQNTVLHFWITDCWPLSGNKNSDPTSFN
jgi:hypothetical protein